MTTVGKTIPFEVSAASVHEDNERSGQGKVCSCDKTEDHGVVCLHSPAQYARKRICLILTVRTLHPEIDCSRMVKLARVVSGWSAGKRGYLPLDSVDYGLVVSEVTMQDEGVTNRELPLDKNACGERC